MRNLTPIRYAGGKSRAVKHILPRIPKDIDRLVSPFFGGGAVEIAAARELGCEVIGSDIFDILTNYWGVQLSRPADLANRLREWRPSKRQYAEVKERLRAHWKNEIKVRNKLELAALYWFNHNLSYGPGFLGWMSKIYEDRERYTRMVDRVGNFDAPGVEVQTARFKDVIQKYWNDFLYCDPPYYLGEGSKMFKGIYPQRNFPVHHNYFKHELLRDMLYAHDGGFVLSYNDCPTIREWYRNYRIIEVGWQYTMGQGETRIGKNRKDAGANHVKKSHELLIVKV